MGNSTGGPSNQLLGAVERYGGGFVDTIKRLRTALTNAGESGPQHPPGAGTEIGQLLMSVPRPLLNRQARMLLVFSAKSACTNVVIWFFHHLGHLQAARDFHYWPHEYRQRVYYNSNLYKASFRPNMTRYRMVRVVRDPYDRAASSFRHMVRHAFADAEIARRLNYRDMARKGLSFETFLDFLETLDLAACDPHFRIQRHPVEDRLPVRHLINISKQNLYERLNDVEAALGLPQFDLSASPWVQGLRKHNRPDQEFVGGGDTYRRVFTRDQARDGPWPDDKSLLTPEARARIARLYAIDIKAYT